MATLVKPPAEGGLGLITPTTAWVTMTLRWWTDMLMHPNAFWQRGMWHLITQLCSDFKKKLVKREIPAPPPNTPEPLSSRWKILQEECEMTEPLDITATV